MSVIEDSQNPVHTPKIFGHTAFAVGGDLVVYGNTVGDSTGSNIFILDTGKWQLFVSGVTNHMEEHRPTVTLHTSTIAEDMVGLIKSGLLTDINFILNNGYAKGESCGRFLLTRAAHKVVISSRSKKLAELCDQVKERRGLKNQLLVL